MTDKQPPVKAFDGDDAMWEAAVANNPEKFERLLAEADQAIADGMIDELNPMIGKRTDPATIVR